MKALDVYACICCLLMKDFLNGSEEQDVCSITVSQNATVTAQTIYVPAWLLQQMTVLEKDSVLVISCLSPECNTTAWVPINRVQSP